MIFAEKLATLSTNGRAISSIGAGEKVVDFAKLCDRLVGDLCVLETAR